MKPYHTMKQWLQFFTELTEWLTDCIKATVKEKQNKKDGEK